MSGEARGAAARVWSAHMWPTLTGSGWACSLPVPSGTKRGAAYGGRPCSVGVRRNSTHKRFGFTWRGLWRFRRTSRFADCGPRGSGLCIVGNILRAPCAAHLTLCPPRTRGRSRSGVPYVPNLYAFGAFQTQYFVSAAHLSLSAVLSMSPERCEGRMRASPLRAARSWHPQSADCRRSPCSPYSQCERGPSGH